MFQLGSEPISYKEYFNILFENAQINLDSNIESQYKQKEDQLDKNEIDKLNKQQILLLLLQILNQENCTTYEQIKYVLERYQNAQILNEYTKTELNKQFRIYQTPKVVTVSILYQIIPIFILSTSLFNEASCSQCKILTTDFSKFNSASLKYICQGLQSLCMNSKKVNFKKESQFFEQTIFTLEQAQDYLSANKILVKNILSSGSLPCLIAGQLEEIENQQQKQIDEIVQKLYNISCFRCKLMKENFKSEKGIWKAMNVDELYQNEKQENNQFTLEQFIQQIHDEFKLMFNTLISATTGFKCFISQYNNELLQQQNITQISVSELSQFAQEHLSTHTTIQRVPQPPAGTRDIMPEQYFIRQQYINKIIKIFQQHGAVSIETPVFESTALLTSKYGDDEALIYNLQDFGETPLSLRYDLTVPFARYCVTHNIKQIRRYQLGKVYRRDKPDIKNGRFREFYQLDFDIGGGENLVSDAEVLSVVGEVISLFTDQFQILVNSRPLLNALCRYCKIPDNKFKGVCSSIDALDKVGVEGVKDKLINQKGIDQNTADLICKLVLQSFKGEEIFNIKDKIEQELFNEIEKDFNDIKQIFEYLKLINPSIINNVVLDFSLARGLDYYTGMIFEVKLTDNRSSVSAGGRYDHLLQTINPTSQMNVVGGSIGIERLFALLEQKLQDQSQGQERELDVYICSLPGCQLNKKLNFYGQLIKAGLRVGMNFKQSGSLKAVKSDLQEATLCKCKYAIMVGGDEIQSGKYKIKDLSNEEQVDVEENEVCNYIVKQINQQK